MVVILIRWDAPESLLDLRSYFRVDLGSHMAEVHPRLCNW